MGYAFIGGGVDVGSEDVDVDIVVNVVVVTFVVTSVVTVVVFGSLPPSMRGVAKNKRITK